MNQPSRPPAPEIAGHTINNGGSFRVVKFLRRNLQFFGLAIVIAALAGLILLIRHGLRTHNIPFNYGFLHDQAGFDISPAFTIGETSRGPDIIAYTGVDSNLQAVIAGAFNTELVSCLAIIMTTILGVLIGVSRLSSNWMARQWAFWYVELIRNTPLLVQLAFWYFAVFVQLPPVSNAFVFPGGVIASQRGIALPAPHFAQGSHFLFIAAAAASLLAWSQRRYSVRLPTLCAVAVGLLIIGWAVSGSPIIFDHPVASRFRITNGIILSPEMAALVLAFVVNSAAFIAEIVRGAIQSVSRGQWEAADSLGLGRGETLRVIILPQAVRVIIPSLGNQYISLAKNTSLGIAIGFPDLFNVYGTVANQTGRSLEGILIVMCVYLVISFGISGATNLVNRRLVRKGART